SRPGRGLKPPLAGASTPLIPLPRRSTPLTPAPRHSTPPDPPFVRGARLQFLPPLLGGGGGLSRRRHASVCCLISSRRPSPWCERLARFSFCHDNVGQACYPGSGLRRYGHVGTIDTYRQA